MPTDTTIITPISTGDPVNAAEPNDLAVQLQDALVAALRGTAAGQTHEAPLFEVQGSDPANGSIPASHVREYYKSDGKYYKDAANQVYGPQATSGGAFLGTLSGALSVPSGVLTKVPWDAEDFDVLNEHSTINGRFTPSRAGKYKIIVNITWTNLWTISTTTTIMIVLYKNGAFHRVGSDLKDERGGTHNCSFLVTANGTTDYFEVFVQHNFGSNQPIYNVASHTWWAGYFVRT